jgi:DNA polymerase III alpha subunit (gram-positive type)
MYQTVKHALISTMAIKVMLTGNIFKKTKSIEINITGWPVVYLELCDGTDSMIVQIGARSVERVNKMDVIDKSGRTTYRITVQLL